MQDKNFELLCEQYNASQKPEVTDSIVDAVCKKVESIDFGFYHKFEDWQNFLLSFALNLTESGTLEGSRKELIALLKERSKVGIKKYGTTLADSKEDLEAFKKHLLCELLDATNYTEKLVSLLTKE